MESPQTGTPEPVAPAPFNFSLTASPVLLIIPLVELTLELSIIEKLGVAGIVGFGRITAEPTGFSEGRTYTALEFGAQVNYYILDRFDGLHVGLEGLAMRISTSDDGGASGSALGFNAGPYLGYKFIASFGLTFVAQLGYAVGLVKASASDGDQTASASSSGNGPLLNLNLGWSF
ncbi:MAG: hypothetical protein H0U74_12575 [Bradymonadaceae bacterium]|nr:hypothetical protein [Lujinxingiaceae bacterium]